jgi:hypothetical protein
VKKIIEVGPANLVYLCWLFGLEEDGSTEGLRRKNLHLFMQTSQGYNIGVIDQRESSRRNRKTGEKS